MNDKKLGCGGLIFIIIITKENMVLLLQEKSENRICCKCQYKNAQKVEQLKSL